MVITTNYFEQVHFTCHERRADPSFGTTTSQGYADNVPAYFRRQSYDENEDRIHRTNGNTIKKLDDLSTNGKTKSPPTIGKIEKLLTSLSSLVNGYQPLTRRKALLDTAGFLGLQKKIRDVLENIELDNETIGYYETKYAELIQIANEKSQKIIKQKNKLTNN